MNGNVGVAQAAMGAASTATAQNVDIFRKNRRRRDAEACVILHLLSEQNGPKTNRSEAQALRPNR
ncbi:hypothetical protein Busp01_02900 [Trinickia caryophylli]|nr:hypothetical protein Busp01_02900 [Trinickia caryophylli]